MLTEADVAENPHLAAVVQQATAVQHALTRIQRGLASLVLDPPPSEADRQAIADALQADFKIIEQAMEARSASGVCLSEEARAKEETTLHNLREEIASRISEGTHPCQ
jgi:hypothetical protein